MTSDFQFTVAKDEVTGIYKGTLDIQLPPICVTRYKADKNDFKYEMSRAVTEVVEEFMEPDGVVSEEEEDLYPTKEGQFAYKPTVRFAVMRMK